MTIIKIQNLKCHGCANTILKGVQAIEGVTELSVDVDESKVTFSASDYSVIDVVKTKLSKLGYPEIDASNTTLHKAKSFVSCAVGRIND